MKAARSQEYEDQEDTEQLGEEYRIHHFPPEPNRSPFSLLDLAGLAIIIGVAVFFLVAIALGVVAEVKLLNHLFR